MKIKLYKSLPYLLIYTDNLPDNFGGYNNGPLVRIKPKYKDDIGLAFHEITHVAQWWRTLGFHSLMYLLSKKYKVKAEVEAYREQLKHEPASLDPERYRDMYAGFICDNYNLDISKGDVLKIL